MKKTLFLASIILLIIVGVFLVWQIFSREEGTTPGQAVRNVLPFGTGEDINIPPLSQNTFEESELFGESGAPKNNLFVVANTPVAGFNLTRVGGQTVVRYVERATGHISEVVLPRSIGSEPLERRKLTNNTIPKVYEAIFRPDGNALLMRTLNEDLVENIVVTLTAPLSTSTESLYSISTGNFRPDARSITPGPNNTLIYTVREPSSIISSTFIGTTPRTILSNPFKDWAISSAGNSLVVFTKPSSLSGGYAYNLNPNSNSLTKILGPLNSLVAKTSPSGRLVYSYEDAGRTRLFTLFNNNSQEFSPATLADKCAWSPSTANLLGCGAPINGLSSGEPELWYLGVSGYSDRIWLFNTDENVALVASEPHSSLGLDLDVYQPQIALENEYFVFINKRDLTLWALKLDSQP